MNGEEMLPEAKAALSGAPLLGWRAAQMAVLATGFGIFLALLFLPDVGRHALWNVLITAAPALFVIAPGLWRNVCPLASVALLPHHLSFSQNRRLSPGWQDWLSLGGVALLLVIVPARHVLLDSDPQATAWTLAALGAAALLGGFFFDRKSGWCNSLCPVLPVEKVYGQKPWLTVANAHCGECRNCTIPCPDSASGTNVAFASERRSRRLVVNVSVGGLPGFVWGWFHVPVYRDGVGLQEVLAAYGSPWGTMLISLGVFWALRVYLGPRKEAILACVFAAAAVSCYYWYRIPALVGYGLFPPDGLLLDLRQVVPAWSVTLAQVAVTAFFVWWLVIRQPPSAVWAVRPPYAAMESPKTDSQVLRPGRLENSHPWRRDQADVSCNFTRNLK
jgi:hypothetical protein